MGGVRALLILVVLALWAMCLIGAIGFTSFLAATATRSLRSRQAARRVDADAPPLDRTAPDRRPATPAPGTVPALLAFAALMAGLAVVLAGTVLWARTPGTVGSALAWAALPLWTSFTAAGSALVLHRRRTGSHRVR